MFGSQGAPPPPPAEPAPLEWRGSPPTSRASFGVPSPAPGFRGPPLPPTAPPPPTTRDLFGGPLPTGSAFNNGLPSAPTCLADLQPVAGLGQPLSSLRLGLGGSLGQEIGAPPPPGAPPPAPLGGLFGGPPPPPGPPRAAMFGGPLPPSLPAQAGGRFGGPPPPPARWDPPPLPPGSGGPPPPLLQRLSIPPSNKLGGKGKPAEQERLRSSVAFSFADQEEAPVLPPRGPQREEPQSMMQSLPPALPPREPLKEQQYAERSLRRSSKKKVDFKNRPLPHVPTGAPPPPGNSIAPKASSKSYYMSLSKEAVLKPVTSEAVPHKVLRASRILGRAPAAAPPPPPPPPPAAPQQQQQQAQVFPLSSSASRSRSASSGRGGLLGAIQAGKSLKKVEVRGCVS